MRRVEVVGVRQGIRLHDSPCDPLRDPWFRITKAERQRQPRDRAVSSGDGIQQPTAKGNKLTW